MHGEPSEQLFPKRWQPIKPKQNLNNINTRSQGETSPKFWHQKRETENHNRTTALERSEMNYLVGQLNKATKLATVIGLTTKHEWHFNYSQTVCDISIFFETDQKNQSYRYSFFNLYTKLILVPIDLDKKKRDFTSTLIYNPADAVGGRTWKRPFSAYDTHNPVWEVYQVLRELKSTILQG